MKLKTLLATLLGTFLLQHLAICQTNVVMPDQPAVAAVTNEVAADIVTNAPVEATAVTNQPDVVVASNAMAEAVASNAPVEAVASNAMAEAVASNAPMESVAMEASAKTNAAVPEVASIPLIQFQDVPITTAIENLARQANINYLLDPKIGYGQPDANGQIKAEPNLSIRWENIPAQHA